MWTHPRRPAAKKKRPSVARLGMEALEDRSMPAAFTPGDVVVYRVGDGSATLTGAATVVFLDEYTPAGALVQSITMPTQVGGANQILTASGTATAEGALSLSADGRFVLFTGYNAAPGAANVASSPGARTIGLVGADGTVNTTTTTTSFGSNSIRTATSTNGTDIWVTGTASTVGVGYTTLGSSAALTNVVTAPTTNRTLGIFGGQLYVSSSSGTNAFKGIDAVGIGVPTTAGQTATRLPGLTDATTASSYAFFFADLDAGVAGVDTLYVADDGTGVVNSGIQKYSLVGGNWTPNGTIPGPSGSPLAGVRGLTGVVSGTSVTLYASNPGNVSTLTDTSGYNATITGTVSGIAIPGTNRVFRGVVMAPTQPPVVTLPGGAAAYTENGGPLQLDTGATVSDADSPNFDTGKLTVDFSANGSVDDRLEIKNDGTGANQIGVSGSNVTFGGTTIATFTGGSGTTPLVVTFNASSSPAAAQALVRNVTFRNVSDDPSTAARTVRFVLTDGDGATSAAATKTVNVTAVNDAPTLTATAGNPTYTEDGAAVAPFGSTAVGTVEAGQKVAQFTLTVSGLTDGANEILRIDGTDVALTNGNSATTATNSLSVSVTVANGTAAVTVGKSGGVSASTATAVIDGIAYRNASQDPTAGNRVATLKSISDDGGTAGGGQDTAALSIASTVTVVAVNDAPTLTATAGNPTFTENGSAVALFSGASAGTVEAGQNLDQITLTVANLADGASEVLVIDGTGVALTNGNSVTTTNGLSVGVTVAGTTATVTVGVSGGLPAAVAAGGVNAFAYRNTSEDPTAGARVVTLTGVRDTGGTANGGANTAALSIASTVTVVAVNDAPTLTATATGPTYTEDGSAVALFSGTAIGTVEAGQKVAQFTLTVSGLTDGANEILRIDGTDVALTNGNSATTATNSLSVGVTVSGSTATVTVSKSAGVSTSTAATVANGIAYRNASQDPTAGNRVATLTSVTDDGGVANGGANTATLSIASTVTEVPVNDAPTLTATATNPTSIEGAAAVALFSGASAGTVEAGQSIDQITLTVANLADGGGEILRVDGTDFSLVNGASGTTAPNGLDVSVAVSGTTATVTIGKSGGVSASVVAAVVNALAYRNASIDSTAGARVVTLTGVRDTGGTANGGANTATLSIASTVTEVPVNDPPTFSATAANPTYTEGGPAVSPFSTLGSNVIESGQGIKQATLTVSNVTDGASEILVVDGSDVALTNGNTVTTAGNGATVTVSVTGTTATVTIGSIGGLSLNAAFGVVSGPRYRNASDNPTPGARVVTYTSLTDTGGTANGGADTSTFSVASTVTVVAVNDTPTLDDPADASASVGIAKTVTLTGITAGGGESQGLKVEATSDTPGVVASPVPVTYTSPNATGSLTFTPLSAGTATITVRVTDDNGTPANPSDDLFVEQSFKVAVTANLAPVNTAPASVTTDEDTAFAFTGANAITVSDPDNTPGDLTTVVAVPAGRGTLTATGAGVTGSGTGSVTITGAAAAVNAALATLAYAPPTDGNNTTFGGAVALAVSTTDALGGNDADTVSVTVTPVNDRPSFTASNPPAVDEDAGAVTVSPFATFSPGPATATDETATQTVPAYSVSAVSNPALFASGPSVSTAGVLTYTLNPNVSGSSTFDLTVRDSGGTPGTDTSPAQTFTVTVNSVNDAPSGANKTVTTAEDADYVFAASVFGFTDPNDSPANNLVAVKITTLPGAGTLTDNGVAVTAGQFIPVADITGGLLKFSPTGNANGASYASFTFQVQDDGGTSGTGADLDPTANTLTIDVTAVNDAPAGADTTVTTNEDTGYTFTPADFGFSDPKDSPASAFLAVKVATLPGAGTLTDNGVAVTAGQFVPVADIAGGLLKFVPATDANGSAYASFTFQVQDNGGGADLDPTPNVVTIDVTAVNDAPSAAVPAAVVVAQDSGAFAQAAFATGFTPGPATATDETAQTAVYVVTDDNKGLFGVQPAIDATGKLTFTPAAGAGGTAKVTVVVKDSGPGAPPDDNTGPTLTFTITVTPAAMPVESPVTVARGAQFVAIGSDAGTPSLVRVLDARTGAVVRDFSPFGAYAGGVRVAVADLNGDGTDDVVAATAGGIALAMSFDGATGAPIGVYAPFGLYPSGLQVATGDVDGDGKADLIFGLDTGPGVVLVYSGATGQLIRAFDALFGLTTGVRLAAGDVNGDGKADVAVAAGPGGYGLVTVTDGASGKMASAFFAAPGYGGEVNLAVGDLTGDGRAEVITTITGAFGTLVEAFGAGGDLARALLEPATGQTYGLARTDQVAVVANQAARVSAGDVNGDHIADILLADPPGTGSSKLLMLDGATGAVIRDGAAFDPLFGFGVFVDL